MAEDGLKATHDVQYEFTAHIRHPERYRCPEGVPDRRMSIYRDLFYNNIESFISSGFPVLKRLLPDAHWHAMVRDFLHRHRCKTPYFPEISEEFLEYLQLERGTVEGDPAFMIELAHYEWVELALSILDEDFPNGPTPSDLDVSQNEALLQCSLSLSPLAWILTYQWPVHRISKEYYPESSPDAPTYLLVYRNRQDEVKFKELNPVTARLVSLLKESSPESGADPCTDQARASTQSLLDQIAKELEGAVAYESVLQGGLDTLRQFYHSDIVIIG